MTLFYQFGQVSVSVFGLDPTFRLVHFGLDSTLATPLWATSACKQADAAAQILELRMIAKRVELGAQQMHGKRRIPNLYRALQIRERFVVIAQARIDRSEANGRYVIRL